jgi:hypothetical protein
MHIGAYNKAIAAFLTALVGMIALWWPPVANFASPELVATVASLIGSLLVYAIPNKPAS